MSNKEEITAKEEFIREALKSKSQLAVITFEDGTKKTFNKAFIVTIGVDSEKERLEELKILDDERKKRAAIAQKAALEEVVETDIIEKYIK